MLLHSIDHPELASRELALTITEAVFKKVYGEDAFKKQLPLHIREQPDRWIIKGSQDYSEIHPETGDLHGPLIVEILKANCQIVNLAEMAAFPPLEAPT